MDALGLDGRRLRVLTKVGGRRDSGRVLVITASGRAISLPGAGSMRRWDCPIFRPYRALALAGGAASQRFLQFFFVHEHFARYLTPISDRQEPWWFFGWVFLAGTVPWTFRRCESW